MIVNVCLEMAILAPPGLTHEGVEKFFNENKTWLVRTLDLPFQPALKMTLSLKVGNKEEPFEVRDVSYSETSQILLAQIVPLTDRNLRVEMFDPALWRKEHL